MSNSDGPNPELFPRACCVLAVLFFLNINNRLKMEKLKNICEFSKGKTNAISGGRGVYFQFTQNL